MMIGELARRAGLKPSAIRYYERAGLMPAPRRQSGRRIYEPDDIGRLRLVQLALAAGFTVAEARRFVAGFDTATPPAARWRRLAERKLMDIGEQMQRLKQMEELLQTSFRCRCPTIADCANALARKTSAGCC